MPDDLSKSSGQDRTRINTSQPHELRDWAKKFGITTEQLRAAVAQVGNEASKVEEHLKVRKGAKRATAH